ncbi:sodium:proton antiporter [Acidiphilium sp. PA]|uniref:sodium:proton antiporter n=1 Tax=Acidiphilium sp. PA TaxID=2871705 RepID=UPI002243EAEB|nr:sodium:proton antiporter [Acidiphilium sp. PA]MCW8307226.1 sodium:proton antiporter [Acidiphilium sp. PA]
MTSLAGAIPSMLPFIGTLLSFALLPGLAPHLWHRRMVPITLLWVALGLALTSVRAGPVAALDGLWVATAGDFLPFIAILMALYTLGGGVLIAGGPWGRPGGNVLLLAIGTVLAGVMGTIGAALLLIHPLLAANGARRERRHLVLAFIILVANAGGALSPLGDPPLLIGFLRGVPFFWPTLHLAWPVVVIAAPVLALTYGIDRRLAVREPVAPSTRLRLRGGLNIVLLILFVGAITLSGLVPGPMLAVGPARLPAAQVALTLLAAIVTLISERGTAAGIRARNRFAWGPMGEIAVLFFAIFATIPPVLHLLQTAPLGRNPALWFWLAGLCSALLDSAPTYLMFFQAAGGDAAHLIVPPARLLAAISAGSVFFGAVTYLGNAPNLMIRAVAARRGVPMPGFFGYCAAAGLVLGPLLIVQTILFFI